MNISKLAFKMAATFLIELGMVRVVKALNVEILSYGPTFAYLACVLLRIARTQTYAVIPNNAQWIVLTTYSIRRLAHRPAPVAR